MNKKTIFYFLLLVFLSSCATNQLNFRPSSVSYDEKEQKVVDKNYKLGVTQKAFIGDPIIKVKDYVSIIKQKIETKVTADNDFTIKVNDYGLNDFGLIIGKKGQEFEIAGSTNFNGIDYNLIRFYGGMRRFDLFAQKLREEFLLPINKNGILVQDPDFFWQVGYPPRFVPKFDGMKYSVKPTDTKFNLVTSSDESVSSKSGYINYEIVFTGTDKDSIKLVYREFTPDNLARPAFYQNLSYTKEDKYIRFKNILILVKNVNNQEIEYTVVEN